MMTFGDSRFESQYHHREDQTRLTLRVLKASIRRSTAA